MSENDLQILHQKMQTLRQYVEEYDRRVDAAQPGSEDRAEAEQAVARTQEELDRATAEYHRLGGGR